MTHAVLTLRGLDVGREDRMAEFLGGYAVLGGRTHITVDYGDDLFDSISDGVRILDEQITSALALFDRVTVECHSKGCVIAGHWMGKRAKSPTAPG